MGIHYSLSTPHSCPFLPTSSVLLLPYLLYINTLLSHDRSYSPPLLPPSHPPSPHPPPQNTRLCISSCFRSLCLSAYRLPLPSPSRCPASFAQTAAVGSRQQSRAGQSRANREPANRTGPGHGSAQASPSRAPRHHVHVKRIKSRSHSLLPTTDELWLPPAWMRRLDDSDVGNPFSLTSAHRSTHRHRRRHRATQTTHGGPASQQQHEETCQRSRPRPRPQPRTSSSHDVDHHLHHLLLVLLHAQ